MKQIGMQIIIYRQNQSKAKNTNISRLSNPLQIILTFFNIWIYVISYKKCMQHKQMADVYITKVSKNNI